LKPGDFKRYETNEFNVYSPTTATRALVTLPRLVVALQGAFERQTLKPVFSLDRV
jgi:hypothetical protein